MDYELTRELADRIAAIWRNSVGVNCAVKKEVDGLYRLFLRIVGVEDTDWASLTFDEFACGEIDYETLLKEIEANLW